ncbi:MAG: excinuclease ABC subunit UvrA, partial [Methylococcaceae bacterium]|nr:excinuclease ABC subunit UvrA [Methylococcaceae bacterium]
NSEDSLTGQYLSGKVGIAIPESLTPVDKDKQITIRNAHGNNLKNVDISFPVGLLTCVTGVSGSGKSTLVNDTLYCHAARLINRAGVIPSPCDAVEGLEHFDKVVDIDQSPIGRTPRSNPATYTGLFTPIRELFSATPEARSRGYTPGRFSFNVKGGRCEACKGDGVIKVEMHFLPDIFVHCDACNGKRYNRETLEIRYKGKTINQVLDMTVEDAAEFFSPVPTLARKLHLYILDEPTTGLHFHDIKQLLGVLHTLRDHGNTVIVIEHNLDVIKTADWLIDMGPEGGDGGGTLVAEGSPKQVSENAASYTGMYLKRFFE